MQSYNRESKVITKDPDSKFIRIATFNFIQNGTHEPQ